MIDDIKKTLWATADKLRANMDAAEYKHLVLGLIFVKYISDTFAARRIELARRFADPADDYWLADADNVSLAAELEDRDYYTEVNVFWVPESARWESLRAAAKQPDIGKRIDDALSIIEVENPKLKGILDKRYARAQLPDGKLGELVDLVSTIGFGDHQDNGGKARDVLGQVYEYFLGQFASAEGKKGGQFYTPASIVKTLVAVLAPHHGKVYDPCCGSGGMFVQSEKFIEAHGGKLGDVSIYGQESNPTTWRLAAMNLAIRGIDFNLGREPADTFIRNQHPDLRADFILANPPFNISDWWHASLTGDSRWEFGDPPAGNANYAWLQHMVYHLKPTGHAGIVLANGSMSSSQNSEGDIRRAMVEADVVEIMIALPGQLFFNTQIPACLWFLAKQKAVRKGEVLFIDARKLGTMISRVQAELTDEVIERIAATVAAWRGEADAGDYQDIPGFCRSVKLNEIAEHGHVLTPGRYVGAEAVENDDIAFADKMQALTEKLGEQMAKGAELDALIRQKLGGGWGMNFESCTLADLAAPIRNAIVGGPFGSNLVSNDYVESGVPVIRGQNMGGKWVSGEFAYVSEEKARALSQNAARPGDLVFTQRGTLGQVSIIPRGSYEKYIVSQSQMKITVAPDKADVAFLYYLFKTAAQIQYIFNSAIQTGVPHTNLGILKATPVQLPPLPVQKEIAAVMNALDDRITLLRETNATLEAIAQALFKSWFVDFDPVRAKQKGRVPDGMDEATAALFPDSFEESELGLVPKGWHWALLANAYEINPHRSLKKGMVAPYLDMANVPTAGHCAVSVVQREMGSGSKFRNGDTLLARITPCLENGKSAFVDFLHDGEIAWGSTEFLVLRPKLPLPAYHAYLLCRHPMFREFAVQSMSGTSGRQRVQSDMLGRYQLALPNESVAFAFAAIVEPIQRRVSANHQQAQTLATLRDTMLPRLISGQLRLPEAEAVLDESMA